MELRITTLIENMPDDAEELLYEHGLSLYIEFHGKRILFDTGQSGDFLKNAKKQNKEITGIDYALVSHGHYDHSGGVMQTAELLDSRTRMFVGNGFFAPKYKLLEDGSYKYNGNTFTQQELTEKLEEKNVMLTQLDDDVTYLDDNIVIFKNFESATEFEQHNPNFFIRQEPHCCDGICYMGGYCQDTFQEEIALGLITSKGLVLIVGCSHVGIVNIIRHVKKHVDIPINCVLGGTHLVAADKERLEKTIEVLKELEVAQIAVSHCTGDEGMSMLQKHFGKNYIKNNTGNVFIL